MIGDYEGQLIDDYVESRLRDSVVDQELFETSMKLLAEVVMYLGGYIELSNHRPDVDVNKLNIYQKGNGYWVVSYGENFMARSSELSKF